MHLIRTLGILILFSCVYRTRMQAYIHPCQPNDGITFNGYCYRSWDSMLSFSAAEGFCVNSWHDWLNAHLVSVHSLGEMNLLAQFNSVDRWIGLKKNVASTPSGADCGVFADYDNWTDASAVDWIPADVDCSFTPLEVGIMVDTIGQWRDKNIMGTSGHICKFKIPVCSSIMGSETLTVCGGRGICIADDTCKCNSGYFGAQCAEFGCFGFVQGGTSTCSGHGVCTGPDKCDCVGGYFGEKCDGEVSSLVQYLPYYIAGGSTLAVVSGGVLLFCVIFWVVLTVALLRRKNQRINPNSVIEMLQQQSLNMGETTQVVTLTKSVLQVASAHVLDGIGLSPRKKERKLISIKDLGKNVETTTRVRRRSFTLERISQIRHGHTKSRREG